MHMAVLGARRRIIGLSSPVATTVTACLRCCLSASSRNSRTSRPRSPTSADDDGVEAAGAGEHGEQRRLADAGAGEDADALAGAERREEVDDLDAGLQRRAGALPAHGRRRLAIAENGALALEQRRPVVDGRTQRVDDAALPGGMRADGDEAAPAGGGAESRLHGRIERLDGDAALVDADDLAELGLARRCRARRIRRA